MNVGDKKQAVILSVVALGAIGFLGSRMVPPKLPALLRQASGAEAPAEPKATPANLILAHDPFFHARLVRLAETKPKESDNAPPSGFADRDPLSIPLEPLPGGMSLLQPSDPSVQPSTKEQAPKNRAIVTGKPLNLRLQATMTVDQGVALISINEGECRSFRAGGKIASGIVVTVIDASGVTIRNRKKAIRLEVGDACSL